MAGFPGLLHYQYAPFGHAALANMVCTRYKLGAGLHFRLLHGAAGAPRRDAEVAEVLHAPGFAPHYAEGIRQGLSLLSCTLRTGCAPGLLV